MRKIVSAALALVVGIIGGGCDPVAPSPGASDAGVAEAARISLSGARELDLLFVVDNSGSMTEEQASLVANADRFINALAYINGGLPSLHLGVISTDLGAGDFNISNCNGNGDNGALHNVARGECMGPAGSYIRHQLNADGTRTTNYTGSLTDVFRCIVPLGIEGCGFEQPLESMRRALDGSIEGNDGFLRAEAQLAVVFLTDEDDCSASDDTLFDTSSTTVDDPLGPVSSFRCFDFGVVCDGDDPRPLGEKTGCVPREDSAYLHNVSGYVDFLRGLKDDPGKVSVAAIFGGAATDATVVNSQIDTPEVKASCVSDSGSADPGFRLGAFVAEFPGRQVQTSICKEDLSEALLQVAELLSQRTNTLCLAGTLADVDPASAGVQASCEVVETLGSVERSLPGCIGSNPAEAANKPCYVLAPDQERCGQTSSQLSMTIYRDSPPEVDGELVARCELP